MTLRIWRPHLLAKDKPLAVDIQGAGEPIIFLHGLGSTSSVWEPQIHALPDGFMAIRYDLRGSGRSELGASAERDASLSIESWGNDLLDLMNANDIKRARFVGHSLGTLILQHFAVNHPERVASLALIGVNRAPTEQRRQAVRERVAKVRANGIAPLADTIVKGGLSGHSFEHKPEVVGFVRELLLGQPREGYAASCEAMAASTAADITQIKCPVLVVSGQDDNVSPPANGEAFARELSNGEFVLIEKCGHWQPIEQPAAVSAALNAFFTRN